MEKHPKFKLWDIFINLINWDPKDREDSSFVKMLSSSHLEIEDIILLSKEEFQYLHSLAENKPNLSFRFVSNISFLQFYLKIL